MNSVPLSTRIVSGKPPRFRALVAVKAVPDGEGLSPVRVHAHPEAVERAVPVLVAMLPWPGLQGVELRNVEADQGRALRAPIHTARVHLRVRPHIAISVEGSRLTD